MSMNEFLAQFYGTNGATEVEKVASEGPTTEQEKIAMFAKLAKDNNIDLSQLSDEKLEKLFSDTFDKTAGELPPQFQKKDEGEKKDDKKDEKSDEEKKAEAEKAAADAEQEKKAEEARLEKQAAEADFMGRIMAHAYVNEMRKIAASAEKPAESTTQSEPEKTASLREKLLKLANEDCPPGKKDEGKKDEKKDGDDKGKSLPPWMKDKEASASLEEAACQHALAIVQEFNKTAGENAFDVKIAAERVAAVHTLGLSESAKVASAETVEAAVAIRALEYLDAAGYPVQWPA